MFFVLSKIFWIVAAPSHWLALLVVAALLFLLLRRPRAALVCVTGAVLLILAAWLVTAPLLHSLEDQYARPAWPAHVDGILVLGGGYDSALLRARHAPQSNGSAYRLVEGLAAARHYPDARLMFTGGSGRLEGAPLSEAETARYIFTELGQTRMILEDRSRNTYENILFSKAIAKPKPGETWLLVTSAMHMPRAMAIASKLGWPMLAWPSDYITAPDSGSGDPLEIGNLGFTDYAVHEWIGLWAYRLTGKAA
ncbi:MAG TPA: YdcF family protein [Rhizomicrobium sp.]|nr:YdcF family protein [Rhizomicrobium sp.]